MDIKKIRYFITIVDQGGYSAAGRKLFVSQPNLSKSIRSLEADLGGKLLRQIGGKMELTPKGKKLYMLGSHLVEEYDALCDSLRDDQFTLSGSISIGIPPIIGTCVLPDLLYRFQQKYPKISLKICQSPANTIQKMVNDGSIEIGFVILPVLPDTFDAVLVASDTNTLIVHPSHPLAGESSVTYTQLRNEKFILLDNEYILTASIISACREYGYEPEILVETSNWDFVVQLVKINMGVSIIPRRIFDLYPDSGIAQVAIDHRSQNWNVVMIVKKGRYHSQPVRNFISFVKEYILSV